MNKTMAEINTVIEYLTSELIQKDEFDYDIKDALISMLEAKENYSLALKKSSDKTPMTKKQYNKFFKNVGILPNQESLDKEQHKHQEDKAQI